MIKGIKGENVKISKEVEEIFERIRMGNRSERSEKGIQRERGRGIWR